MNKFEWIEFSNINHPIDGERVLIKNDGELFDIGTYNHQSQCYEYDRNEGYSPCSDYKYFMIVE